MKPSGTKPISWNWASAPLAASLSRPSGGKVNRVPSAAGPATDPNSGVAMLSPIMSWNL